MATFSSSEVHTSVGSVASIGTYVAFIILVSPLTILSSFGSVVIVDIGVGGVVTIFNIQNAVYLLLATEIYVVPSFKRVTLPVSSTVATVLSDESHLKSFSVALLGWYKGSINTKPSSSVVSYVVYFLPAIPISRPVTSCCTVIIHVEYTLLAALTAVITAVPGLRAVTCAAGVAADESTTVATFVSEEIHVSLYEPLRSVVIVCTSPASIVSLEGTI